MCGRARGSTKRWLADLQSVLDREGDEVVWRAIHLAHDSGGIVAL
jgi:hypothetical protein